MGILDHLIATGPHTNIDPLGSYNRAKIGGESAKLQNAFNLERLRGIQDQNQAREALQEFAPMLAEQIRDHPELGKFYPLLASKVPELQLNGVAALYEAMGAEKFAATLTPAVDAEGNSVFIQGGDRGTARQLEGFAPPQKTPLVQIGGDQAQETAEAKAEGGLVVKQFETISTDADSARSTLQTLDVLDAIPAETAPGAATKTWVQQLAATVGSTLSADRLNSIKDIGTYRAVASDLLLKKLSAQKGPQTDQDAKRIASALPGIDNIPELNRAINRTLRAQQNRALEQENFWLDWKDRTGSYSGARRAWNIHINKTPMVKSVSGGLLFIQEWLRDAESKGMTSEQALEVWRRM